MDRTRARSGLLIVALALGAAAPAAPPALRAMRWLAPGAEAAHILTTHPGECLVLPADPDTRYRVELGRAAFRDPLVLGGQAARAGLACESCHRDGRNNPDLDIPGLSGAPGTADVTSFLFSSHRGDHIANPKAIPDLGGPKSALKVSQSPGSPALRTFIHGLVTEEFDGAEPPPAILDGLTAYVRALNPAACPAGPAQMRVEDAVLDVRRAVTTAREALSRGDSAAAIVMVQAARSRLGDIAERYAGLASDRSALAVTDLDLAGVIGAVRRADPDVAERLEIWLARVDGWAITLKRDEAKSLYERRNFPDRALRSAKR